VWLRFSLPLASLVLGVLLFHLGDIQVRRTLIEQGGAFEGMPDIAAEAKYVHYALNAPAWTIIIGTTDGRWSPSTYWSGRDVRYFLAVIMMWYLIGLRLDRKLQIGWGRRTPKTWWFKVESWSYLLVGILVFTTLFRTDPTPLKKHLLLLLTATISGGYGWGSYSPYSYGVSVLWRWDYLQCFLNRKTMDDSRKRSIYV
jgi:hypothetical protein